MSNPYGDVVFSYSRAQAIEDGVLVDLMQGETAQMVKESGFKYPIAMTCAAFESAVAPIDGELPAGQDLKGRLWDVLMVLMFKIRAHRGPTDRINFEVSVFDGKKSNLVKMWASCGPGDTPEPVITIMLEGED